MKTILILFLFLLSTHSKTPDAPVLYIQESEGINPYTKIWNVVCYVESKNNPFAVNSNDPNGGSFGIAQIGRLKIAEFNKANGTNYTPMDCFNVDLSKRVFIWHCMNYHNIEAAVKAWNGSGKATLEYWQKICVLLK